MTRGRVEAALWAVVNVAFWGWIIYSDGLLQAGLLFATAAAVVLVGFVILPVAIRWTAKKLARR